MNLLSILLIIILMPIEIVLAILHTINLGIKTIVKLSEGQTIEEIQVEAAHKRLEKLKAEINDLEGK